MSARPRALVASNLFRFVVAVATLRARFRVRFTLNFAVARDYLCLRVFARFSRARASTRRRARHRPTKSPRIVSAIRLRPIDRARADAVVVARDRDDRATREKTIAVRDARDRTGSVSRRHRVATPGVPKCRRYADRTRSASGHRNRVSGEARAKDSLRMSTTPDGDAEARTTALQLGEETAVDGQDHTRDPGRGVA